jgi:hypothetical protein
VRVQHKVSLVQVASVAGARLAFLYRIISTGVERVAFEQSSGGKVQGFEQAVFGQCINGVA